MLESVYTVCGGWRAGCLSFLSQIRFPTLISYSARESQLQLVFKGTSSKISSSLNISFYRGFGGPVYRMKLKIILIAILC